MIFHFQCASVSILGAEPASTSTSHPVFCKGSLLKKEDETPKSNLGPMKVKADMAHVMRKLNESLRCACLTCLDC